jgi:Fe-S-cluster containining protein
MDYNGFNLRKAGDMDELVERTLDIYARFEIEVRRLHEMEPLWNACQDCQDGYCCKRETVPVMKHEWERIVEFVKSNFSEGQKRRLQTNIEKGKPKCPFLMRERCAVYPARTWTCRIYPYTVSHQRVAHNGEFIAPYCSAYAPLFGSREDCLDAFQYTVRERIENTNLIKIRINDQLEFWVIDITTYAVQFAALLPRNEKGVMDGDDMHNWAGVVKLLRDRRQIDQTKFLELLGLD